MKFDAEFFKKEERNGFVIESMMKHAWAAELKVLTMVDDICTQHNITYFADWGTLLGAVRHQGFIPWDDDIDICMKREDFDRFAQVMNVGNEELEFHSIFNDEDWGAHAAHVFTKHLMVTERRKIKEWYGFPFQVGIDIFIIDAVPRDEKLSKEQIDILEMISYARKHKTRKILSQIESACSISFASEYPTDQELLILSEEVMAAYNNGPFDYYTQKDCYVNRDNYFISAEAYAETIMMPFENIYIPIPVGYEEILRVKYGDDYMIPKNIGAGHGYPFYDFFMQSIYDNENFKTVEEADTYIANISGEYYNKFINRAAVPQVTHNQEWFSQKDSHGQAMEELQHIRAAQMEILYELERICGEENMKIFAVGDTLESTLKYQGYAPDEESITLGIMREDYQKFLRVLQEKLDVWFDYRSIYLDEAYDRLSVLVMTDDDMCEEQELLKRFHGCPYTVGVEVLPIDYVSRDDQKEETRNTVVRGLYLTANSFTGQAPYDEKLIHTAEQWNESMNLNLDLNGNLKREFLKAADTYMGMFTNRDGNKVKIFGNDLKGIDIVYDAADFQDVMYMQFEDMMMPVPKGCMCLRSNKSGRSNICIT